MEKKQNKKIPGKGGKRIKTLRAKVEKTKLYTLGEAVDLVIENAVAKFDETVELAIHLGVDPKQSDQMVRGMVSMPNGTGKTAIVAVFAKDAKAEEAKKAGADFVGDEDLVEMIKNNQIEFDVCIASPDMMGVVGKVAKILGPKGKMPNPKLGTVTADVAKAIQSAKTGQVEFRVEKAGIVHVGLAKKSFGRDKIIENINALVEAVVKAKPANSKGTYIKSASISSTMGASVCLDISTMKM